MSLRGRPKTVDPAAVRECQAQGMTQAQTAEHLDISLPAVRMHWEKATTAGRPTKGAEIAERLAAGERVGDIAAALGVSAATIRRHRRAINGDQK